MSNCYYSFSIERVPFSPADRLPPLFGGQDSILGMTQEDLCVHIVQILHVESARQNPAAFCARHTMSQILDRAASELIPLRELVPFPSPLPDVILRAGMREWQHRGCSAGHAHTVVSVHESDGEGVLVRTDGSSVLMSAGEACEVRPAEPTEEDRVRLMLSFDAFDEICKPPVPLSSEQQARLQRIRQKLREKFGL